MDCYIKKSYAALVKLFFLAFSFFLLASFTCLELMPLEGHKLELRARMLTWFSSLKQADAAQGRTNYLFEAELTQGIIFPSLVETDFSGDNQVELTAKSQKIAYLTFDDGPSETTPLILDILKEHNVKATFFVIGNQVANNMDLTRRIVEDGHAVGNHSYSHRYNILYANPNNFLSEIRQAGDLLKDVIGNSPKIVRPPGGSAGHFSRIYIDMLADNGYRFFDWNVDSRDSSAPIVNPAMIRNEVLSQSKDKEIAMVLMHDGPGKITTARALPDIITGLKDMGFTFEVIDIKTDQITALQQYPEVVYRSARTNAQEKKENLSERQIIGNSKNEPKGELNNEIKSETKTEMKSEIKNDAKNEAETIDGTKVKLEAPSMNESKQQVASEANLHEVKQKNDQKSQ